MKQCFVSARWTIKISALFSGSSGNSVYIETQHHCFLVDAGLSGKKIEQALATIDRSASNIDALFVTHEHTDHISAVGVLSRRYNIPVHISYETYRAAKQKLGDLSAVKLFKPSEKIKFSDIVVEPFSIMHDAVEPVGFTFFSNQRKFCLATDIGYADLLVRSRLQNCHTVLIETNYDPDILYSKQCSYPWSVKQRIKSRRGHLSNADAFKLLDMVYSHDLHTVVCGHLSQESNSYERVDELAGSWSASKQVNTIIATQHSATALIEV